ncbi:MAG: hypothetical protein ON057_001688 [Glomeribacter sp. 1016415]|nr:hypothetical protein [Glomeribacter sp. 1016415]
MHERVRNNEMVAISPFSKRVKLVKIYYGTVMGKVTLTRIDLEVNLFLAADKTL